MPFKSEAQRKYLWANEPGIARDWTDTYGSGIAKALGGRIPFYAAGSVDKNEIIETQSDISNQVVTRTQKDIDTVTGMRGYEIQEPNEFYEMIKDQLSPGFTVDDLKEIQKTGKDTKPTASLGNNLEDKRYVDADNIVIDGRWVDADEQTMLKNKYPDITDDLLDKILGFNTKDDPELAAKANAAGKRAADKWFSEASKSGNLPRNIQGEWDKIYNRTRRDIIGATITMKDNQLAANKAAMNVFQQGHKGPNIFQRTIGGIRSGINRANEYNRAYNDTTGLNTNY